MYISCILALMITAAAWAAEGPTSPTKAATAELNGTQADQFMSLTEWSDVKFDKLFTYAGFAQQKSSTVDLGAAFKAGPVYIGAWYQGQFGTLTNTDNRSVWTERTSTIPGWFDGTKQTYGTQISKSHGADHNAAVLLGFGNIGVRLGYERSKENKSGTYYNGVVEQDSTTTNSKTPGVVSNDIVYDPKGYVNHAVRTPAIDVGMKLSVGSLSINPSLGLALKIAQNSAYGRKTTTTDTPATKTFNKRIDITGSNNTEMTFMGKLGADVGLNDSLQSTVSFGYELGIDIYGTKKHTAADGTTKELSNGYTIKEDSHSDVQTTIERVVTDTFDVKKYDKSNIANKITLGYAMQKDFTERLSFFAGVEAPIAFKFNTSKTSGVKTTVTNYTDLNNKLNNYTSTKTVTEPTGTMKTTTVAIAPAFKAAITYALIPSRVFLNFGTQVRPFGEEGYTYNTVKTTYDGFVQTTTNTQKYTNDPARIVPDTITRDNASNTESSMQTVRYNKAKVDVNLGVRWDVIDAVSFDVMYHKSILDQIEWTKIGNLKLACTIKF